MSTVAGHIFERWNAEGVSTAPASLTAIELCESRWGESLPALLRELYLLSDGISKLDREFLEFYPVKDFLVEEILGESALVFATYSFSVHVFGLMRHGCVVAWPGPNNCSTVVAPNLGGFFEAYLRRDRVLRDPFPALVGFE